MLQPDRRAASFSFIVARLGASQTLDYLAHESSRVTASFANELHWEVRQVSPADKKTTIATPALLMRCSAEKHDTTQDSLPPLMQLQHDLRAAIGNDSPIGPIAAQAMATTLGDWLHDAYGTMQAMYPSECTADKWSLLSQAIPMAVRLIQPLVDTGKGRHGIQRVQTTVKLAHRSKEELDWTRVVLRITGLLHVDVFADRAEQAAAGASSFRGTAGWALLHASALASRP